MVLEKVAKRPPWAYLETYLSSMELFEQILSFDSTSGHERALSEWLRANLQAPKVQSWEVGDGTLNLLFSWGEPRVVFCTHVDTVPPYIPPTAEGSRIRGRGSIDAKGQIYAMYLACKQLEFEGKSDFGLLLLSGEETGSWGAKAFAKTDFRAPYLVIGEPTDNALVSASKGTKSFDMVFHGEEFHSGYPQKGRSAVEMFVDFVQSLRGRDFGQDPVLGATTYNIGLLESPNPQNILSGRLTCRVYFRTTFSSDSAVVEFMEGQRSEFVEVSARGGDKPAEYFTPEGFPKKTVSFGSDAPHLSNFTHKMICGPGSIYVAHRDEEYVELGELRGAIENYIRIYESCN